MCRSKHMKEELQRNWGPRVGLLLLLLPYIMTMILTPILFIWGTQYAAWAIRFLARWANTEVE